MTTIRILVGLALMSVLPATPAMAVDRDIYSEINVLGNIDLFVSDARGHPACANFWWVKRLVGSVQQVGRKCGAFTLEVPSLLGISLASKLRASADQGIVVRVTGSKERVAKSVTF